MAVAKYSQWPARARSRKSSSGAAPAGRPRWKVLYRKFVAKKRATTARRSLGGFAARSSSAARRDTTADSGARTVSSTAPGGPSRTLAPPKRAR